MVVSTTPTNGFRTSYESRDFVTKAFVVVGTVYHTPTPDALEVLRNVVIAVGADGRISAIHDADAKTAGELVSSSEVVVRLGTSERLLPGLIDTHIHAPQWPQLGTGLDISLDKWLFEYTFPLEVKYADAGFAHEVWHQMVPTMLRHGTTTAVYYSSIHSKATTMLAETCIEYGQRAFVGRVAMDHPTGTPDWYRDESAASGIEDSAASIVAIQELSGAKGLVEPIITPRFLPACTDELLQGLGYLAEHTGVRVQTHCSESDWEHGYALDRFGASDTEMLQKFGLIRQNSVLAHADHVSDSDLAIMHNAQAGVAHCPLSNAYFANAVFPLQRAMKAGVSVGLGSDVAGGPHVGLLPQCGHAVTASRYLEDGVDAQLSSNRRGVPHSRVDIVTAFHVATAGGAQLLGIDAGTIAVGKIFDAFVVNVDRSETGLHNYEGIDNDERLFEKIVRLAGPSDITAVWVSGRTVHSTR